MALGTEQFIPIVVPVAVALVFVLLRRLVPPRPAQPEGPPLSDAERAAFRRWELGSVALAAVFAVAAGFLWFWGLRALSTALLAKGPGDAFVISPDPESLGIPAIFLGIVSALPALEIFLRAALRGRHARFERYNQERASFDTRRVAVGLGWIVGLAALVFLFYWTSVVTRIGAEGIDLGNAWSLRREHVPWARVAAVQRRETFVAPSGNVIVRPHYAVVLDDGREWTTRGAFRSPPPEADREAMAFVAERAGRRIEQAP